MTKAERILLALLQAGLWEKADLNMTAGLLPCSEEDWQEVYRLAQQQTVSGIIYQGLLRLPDPLLPPRSLLLRWTVLIDRIEQRNRQMNSLLADLFRLFRNKGWEAVVQKGQGTALLYGQPLWRECGDIDLCFPNFADGEKAADFLLKASPQKPEKEADGSLTYLLRGIRIEHHRTLLDFQNPFLQPHLNRFIRKYGLTEAVLPEGEGAFTIPAPMTHVLLLNAHILKHVLGWGIGLRQLCDLALAYDRFSGQLEADDLYGLYRKAGLRTWNDLLHAFLTECIGLPADRLPYPSAAKVSPLPLLEKVMQTGNFGLQRQGRTTAKAWTRKWHTLKAFCQNASFTLNYAPQEGCWTTLRLLKGNL